MIKAILFDVDGVLLDSFEANLVFFQNLMEATGYPKPTKKDYTLLFYKTLHDTVQSLIKNNDEKEINRICGLVDEIDGPEPLLTRGAKEIVKDLSSKYKLGIVTGRIRSYCFEPPLNILEKLFDISVAYEDTKKHKPDPEPLLLAVQKLELQPKECIYIGDAESDFLAATSAKMNFVLYGKNKIRGIDLTISDFKELPKLINNFDNHLGFKPNF